MNEYILLMACLYGMTHALDADHIMAVTGLYSTEGNVRTRAVRLSLHWALGHGFVLLLAAILIYAFGIYIPEEFSLVAEYIVGLLLVAIGIAIVRDIIQNEAHLHFHKHDDLPEHAHWHAHSTEQHTHANHRHEHRAMFVGVIHGLAGLAPLIALFPVAATENSFRFIFFILFFVIGMFATMAFFGGLLGGLINQISKRASQYIKTVRMLAAAGSLILGIYIITRLITA